MIATSAPSTTTATSTTGSPASPRWALASLALATLLASLGTSIANVGLPALARAFDARFPQVQWVVLAYLLASTTLIVSVGRLGDLIGRRRLLLAGIALFTLASALCGAAPTLGALIAARAVQGLGSAVMMALSMALVGETVAPAHTGRAMGVLGTTSAIGTALGPSLGGLLLEVLRWRAIFFVTVPLGLVALALAARHLPARPRVPEAPRPAFDHLGTALLATTLAAYALAMTLGQRGGWGLLQLALLATTACGALLFLRAEARVGSPLVQLAMLRDRGLGACLAMSLLASTVVMSTLVVGPFYLARGQGLEAAEVGLAMSVGPLTAALAGIPAGRLVERLSPARATAIALAAMAAGCFALAVTPAALGVPGYVAPVVVIAVGYVWFQVGNNTAVMAGVAADQRGVVAGLVSLSRNVGLITGASVMGAVFAFAAHAPDVATAGPRAVTAGLHVVFGLAGLLALVALAIAALPVMARDGNVAAVRARP